MTENKMNEMVIYEDLCSVLEEAECSHILEIMFQADPEKVGVNYLGLSIDSPEMVSYIPTTKTEISSTIYCKKVERNSRKGIGPGIRIVESFSAKQERKKEGVKTRIGRLLGRFMDVNLYNKEISRISSILSFDNYELEVVEGEDIRKFYHHESYQPKSGTLNGSCMRHDNCQPYFNVYTNNPDLVKMLVLRKKGDCRSKIRGRAILWQDVELHKYGRIWASDKEEVQKTNEYYFKENEDSVKIKYMDRIYCCTSLSNLFTSWANDNGYHYRGDTFDGNIISAPSNYKRSPGFNTYYHRLSVKTPMEETYYPYLDTFASGYYDGNSDSFVLYSEEADRGSGDRDLQNTNGCVDDETCACCDEGINTEHDDYYVDYRGNYYCYNCGDEELRYIESNDSYYPYDEVDYCDDCETYFVASEGHEVYDYKNRKIYVCSDCAEENYTYIEHGAHGNYYHNDLVTSCNNCHEFILESDIYQNKDGEIVCCECYNYEKEKESEASSLAS